MSDRGEFKANADHQDRVLPNPDKIRFEEDCNDSVDLHSQYESHQYEARQTMAYFESKSVFIFQLIKSSSLTRRLCRHNRINWLRPVGRATVIDRSQSTTSSPQVAFVTRVELLLRNNFLIAFSLRLLGRFRTAAAELLLITKMIFNLISRSNNKFNGLNDWRTNQGSHTIPSDYSRLTNLRRSIEIID